MYLCFAELCLIAWCGAAWWVKYQDATGVEGAEVICVSYRPGVAPAMVTSQIF
jgi:hypothetical protein